MVYIQMGFFWDSLEPEEVVQELSEDIRFLYMHGTADSVIDLDHSQRLFDVSGYMYLNLAEFDK